MTLLLRLLGTLLLLLAGMGGGFAAAARAENSRRQLHSFARLLTYLAELLDAQALTGPELLRRAAQDPAFAVFCPAPGESLSALAGMLRLFWPENGFKSVINAALVLYILTVGVQLVHGPDWDGLVRELRSLPDGQDTADYSDYSRELALAASVDAVREVLRNAGINVAVSWQNGVCVITPVDPRDKPAIEALLAVNAGELPWCFAEAAP